MYRFEFWANAFNITAMSKEFPFSIEAAVKDETAEITISGVISKDNKTITGFKEKVDSFLAQKVKNVFVHIKSPGGDVFVANEIVNELNRFANAPKGEGGVIIASAATYIAMHLEKFEMPKNGQFMYHKPSGSFGGNEDEIQSGLQLLKNITADYKTAYAKKSILSEDQIETNWSSGDVWLTAKQALEQKFITGIIGEASITAKDASLIAACGAPLQPEVKSKIKPSTMDELKLVAQALGLKEGDLSEILASISQLKQDNLDSKTALTALKLKTEEAQKEEAQTILAQLKERKIVEKNAIKAYESLFASNFEDTKKLTQGLLAKAPEKQEGNTSEKLNEYIDKLTASSKDKLNPKDLNFEQLSKENPKLLAKIESENPMLFAELLDEYDAQ